MFNFTIDPKITKEFLLSKNSEETYMSYYLGIPVKKGLFRSPLRADNHNTCSFFRGRSGNLYFKDFATGQCLTFEGVVMEKYHCTYPNALKIIAKDFGYIQSSDVKKQEIKIQPKFEGEKETFIQVEIKDFSESELKWWNSFGITKDILKKFNIHSCKTVFLNGRIFAQSTQHAPIYGYYFGKKENISSLRHIDSEEMTHQLFLRNLYFRIVVRKKIKLYQSSLFVIYPNCTKPINLHLNESFLKKFSKKISI